METIQLDTKLTEIMAYLDSLNKYLPYRDLGIVTSPPLLEEEKSLYGKDIHIHLENEQLEEYNANL